MKVKRMLLVYDYELMLSLINFSQKKSFPKMIEVDACFTQFL